GLVAFLASRSRRPVSGPPRKVRPEALVFVATGVAILVFTLREALSENFWTYPTILLGILVSGAHRPLRHLIDAAYPHRAPVAAAVVFLVLSALAIRTTAACPLAMIGALLALDTFLSRRSASSADVMAGGGMGTAIGFLGRFDLPTFALLALFSAVSFAAMASLDEYADQGGDPRRALGVALLFLPLLVMFFRMPPIVYSLTVVALPEPLEYALYAPTVLLGAACLLLAAFVGLRGHVRTAVRKDYPNQGDGGAVRP